MCESFDVFNFHATRSKLPNSMPNKNINKIEPTIPKLIYPSPINGIAIFQYSSLNISDKKEPDPIGFVSHNDLGTKNNIAPKN